MGICLCAGTFNGEHASGRFEAGEAIANVESPPDGPPAGGKMSRRARAALVRNARTNVAATGMDTSRAVLEYLRSLPRDSSARVAQLRYTRKDAPAMETQYRKTPSLYLKDPVAVTSEAVLDSNQNVYHLRRRVSTNDVRVPLDMKMEDYTALRLRGAVRRNWESLTQFYQLPGETKAGLSDVFAKITKIDIPIPKNPIFSIFGPPHINITINGAVDIHAAFQNVQYDLFTASANGQSQSTPQFSQQVQINVRGEIGDKLKMDADWNTQRTFDYENQLHVKYQGYDDDVVQSVEAGNVSLTTNSSFISSSSALFGIKAKFQAGPLSLTTIASQKKGQMKEMSVGGGSSSQTFHLRPSDYSKDHYFVDTSYIGLYENLYMPAQPIINPSKSIQKIEVWVSAATLTNTTKQRNVVAFLDRDTTIAYQKNRSATTGMSGSTENMVAGAFIQLQQGTDYTYNADAGIITMLCGLQDEQAIAVAYTTILDKDVGNYGSSTPDDTLHTNLVMKLVRPKNLPSSPQMKTAWSMMLKNRYLLGVRAIKKTGFTFNINYTPSGQTPVQTVPGHDMGLLELFGLDKANIDAGTQIPDKVFDYIGSASAGNGITVDENRGEIIFPVLEPFSSASIYRFLTTQHGGFPQNLATQNLADSLSYQAIYDTTVNGAVNDIRNAYSFDGSVTGSQSSTYSIGFNVVEGSVEVDVDGQRAVLNNDYTVDYISGTVTIKNQSFLTPGKNLQIKYEANDMFQLASKTLTGARAELSLSKNTTLGFTIMNMTQESLSDKVRLGEEPISNTIMGFDGSTSFQAPWLTDALNYLPGIKTLAPSQITLRGEYAYMSPNPNTRTSPIPSDHGKSVAYVDDFEGSVQSIPLSVSYTAWKEASPPYYIRGLDSYIPSDGKTIPVDDNLTGGGILDASKKLEYKAHSTWFNVIPTDVIIDTIWGKRKSYATGEGQVTVLNFFYRPYERGMYNYSMNLDSTILDNTHNHRENTWGGCQLVLGTNSTNLQDQNINFIELWVNVQQCDAAKTAKLNIDLGYMSEDVNANKRLDTEDGLGTPIRTGMLDPKNDVGLDSLFDDQERVVFKPFITKYPQYYDDPSGDDWKQPPDNNHVLCSPSTARQWDGCNGMEGNYKSIAGNIPNTEDLNGNNVLDLTNSYFEYELPLDTNNAVFKSYIIGRSPYSNGWLQVRIPLNDYARAIGAPSLTSVEGVRMWVTGTKDSVLFRMTDFNLVGNQWTPLDQNDTTFKVGVVSYEDDPNYDTGPIGVSRPRDLTRPDQNLFGNEQSLSLILNYVPAGQERDAIKWFKARPLNMFNYHTLKMFIHGQDNTDVDTKQYVRFNYDTTHSAYDAELIFRFGTDSLNYYEYRAPIAPGWLAGNDVTQANSMEIHFADLTKLKFSKIDSNGFSVRDSVSGNVWHATYQLRGNPSLTSITYISIGVFNNNKTNSLHGEVWCDELRLLDVDNTPGWAYRLEAGVKFADVASISFGYSQTNPYFHGLEDHFGSYNTGINWNLAATVNWEKFLPESWNGTNLAFAYSHTEGFSNPLYMPGTDVLVDKAVEAYKTADSSAASRKQYANTTELIASTQTLNVTDTYAVPTIHLNIPLSTWLITETINRMSFGFTYTNARNRSTTIEHSEAWNWNANFAYALPLSQNNYIAPFSVFGDFFLFRPWKTMKVFFTPSQISVGASLARSQSYSQTRFISTIDTTRSFTGQRSLGFSWKFFEGGLFDFGTDYHVSVSSSLSNFEINRDGQQRSFSDIMKDIFFSDRLINFGMDQNYGQSISFNTKVTAPHILGLDKIFTPNFKYSVNYGWSDNIQAAELGKAANWNGAVNFTLDVNAKPVADLLWSPTYVRPAADTTKGGKPKINLAEQLDKISRLLFKETIFGFERFNFVFSQQNSAQNNGIVGGNGFANIFARVPFLQSSLPDNGPSLLYQLGLISDPNGEMVMKLKNSFPFITGYTIPGIRAQSKDSANTTATLTDVYSQNNNITMQTSRPLWEGTQLSLNWNVGWSYAENITSSTDPLHAIPVITNRTLSGDMSRSFFTLPPVFIFKNLKMGIDEVNNKYQQLQAADPGDSSSTPGAKLSQAFREGFEGMPWLSKILGDLAPRANWSFHWDGLEKLPLISMIASRASLDHAYMSSYKERWTSAETDDYAKTIQSQTINYAFNPLVGLNFTLKEFVKGNMNATFRYGTSDAYDLVPSSAQVNENSSTSTSFSFTYGRTGMQIPFLGLSLSNDIDFSIHYTVEHSSQTLFDFNNYSSSGIPNGGSSTMTLEPSLKYTLSARVTAQAYYRYKKIEPDASGSTITGSTTNEGGVDIHIAIQ